MERYLCDTCLYANNCQFIAKHKEGAMGCSAYINTYGVSVDRIGEICEAEREGRLVVLPCKVGDTVYEPFVGKVYEKTVDRIIINRFTTPQIWIETKLPFAAPRLERWDMAIGKTVFLTRAEAEAALAEKGAEK